MTPLAQDALPIMAPINGVSRSNPSSSPCSQPPSSPSSSSSAVNTRLFRPWKPVQEEEKYACEEVKDVPREETPRKRRKDEVGGRKGNGREAARVKRSEKMVGKKEEEVASLSAAPPANVSCSAAERLPVVEEAGMDYSLSSLCSASLLAASSSVYPPPPLPNHHHHHLPPHPHLPHGGHLLGSPAFLRLAQQQLPPHPHLDPLLLAEMTEAELERMGLLGCAGAADVAMACGASPASGYPNPSGAASQAKKQRPKKYRCPHCQVAFSNNGQLRGHVRIHTGERPFVCEYEGCDKAFTRNEELTRHRRIHSGQRPFACPLCDKRFGRKDHLKKHARTHAPPPVQAYILPPHHPSDPRFLLAGGSGAVGAFSPLQNGGHQFRLLGQASAAADPTGLGHSQRMMEMTALAGFPYLYGY